MQGYGVLRSEWDPVDVGKVGRIKERDRWSRGAECARELSLKAAGFFLNEDGKPAKEELVDFKKVEKTKLREMTEERWEATPNFQRRLPICW